MTKAAEIQLSSTKSTGSLIVKTDADCDLISISIVSESQSILVSSSELLEAVKRIRNFQNLAN